MDTKPTVYIVIINWNQPEMTIDCLRSVSKTIYFPFELVVVDNGSTDGSAKIIQDAYPNTTIIELSENIGYSEGNNVGIRYALDHDADYILLLNNDTAVDPSMLSQLVEILKSDPRIGIAGPTQFYFDQPDTIWGAANYIRWEEGETWRDQMGDKVITGSERHERTEIVEADYIDTCAALVRREVFEQVGLLDVRHFINFDDADLGLRARKAGFKVVHLPKAKMWHRVSVSMGQASPATTYYMTRNQLLLFWSHGEGFKRVFVTMRIILRTLKTIAAWSIKSEYSSKSYRQRRDANLLALRDFVLGRFGKMGSDVARVCYRY